MMEADARNRIRAWRLADQGADSAAGSVCNAWTAADVGVFTFESPAEVRA